MTHTRKRLLWALSAFALLALAAGLTLDGIFRGAVWLLLGGLVVKTLIAHKAGW